MTDETVLRVASQAEADRGQHMRQRVWATGWFDGC